MAGAWGEVLTEAALARDIVGLAIDGCVRDIVAIEALRFPIFSRALAIGSCTKTQPAAINCPIMFGGVLVRPGDCILGDADGLVVVAQEEIETVQACARERNKAERGIIDRLRAGKTTVELLGLAHPHVSK
jgi:4-hydroxy-4-methyl-2-oxoglutarate aldolase